MRGKVIIIGLDGATWKVIKPLMDKGLLPNIKRLVDSGASGVLRSTIPPVTASAWASFCTGVNPGKHGCYNFVYPDNSLDNLQTIRSDSIKVVTFYEWLERNDVESILINLPCSYPPLTHCITITSLLTVGDQCVFPEELLSESKALRRYRIVPDMRLLAEGKLEEYARDIAELERTRFEAAKYLFKKHWDVFFVLFSGTDWLQHVALQELLGGVSNVFTKVLEDIDQYIGWFHSQLDRDTTMFLVSDHGFKEYEGVFYVNEWLIKAGYLSLNGGTHLNGSTQALAKQYNREREKLNLPIPASVMSFLRRSRLLSSASFSLYLKLKKLLPIDFQLPSQFDLKSSKAFCIGSESKGIYINDKVRFSNGAVRPEDVPTIKDELIEKLRSLRSPSGDLVFRHVWNSDEVYSGDQTRFAPDIILEPDEFDVRATLPGVVTKRRRIFNHDPDGILVATGRGIGERVSVEAASLLDVIPTVYYLLDIGLFDELDGKIISEIITPEFGTTHTMKQAEGRMKVNRETSGSEETAAIVNRLKGLGYLSS